MPEKMRGSTVDRVRSLIMRDIQSGAFEGERSLVTDALAQKYHVSRTPVREALAQLTRDGLVKMIPNAGFRLNRLTTEEVRELFEVRERLEGLAAFRLASLPCPPEVTAALRELSEERRRAVDFDERYRADLAFHQLICDCCGAPMVQQIMHNYFVLSGSLASAAGRGSIGAPKEKDVDAEHDVIIEAIASGRAKLAEKLLRLHVAEAGKAILKKLCREERKKKGISR